MVYPDLLNSFVAESSDLLDEIESALVGYAKLPGTAERAETVNRVFRDFHSLKGSAGFLGFNLIAQLTHEAETFFDIFRKENAPPLDSDTVTLLCKVVDALRTILGSLGPEGGEAAHAGTHAAILEELARAAALMTAPPAQPVPEAFPAQPASAAKAAPAPAPEAAPGTPLQPKEFVARYVAEAQDLLEQAEQALLAIERSPADSRDAVSEAMRVLHSFKGNSGLMGLRDLERLSHAMEAEIERASSSPHDLGGGTVDVLLQMVDVLRQGVSSFAAGGSGAIPECDQFLQLLAMASRQHAEQSAVPPSPPPAEPLSVATTAEISAGRLVTDSQILRLDPEQRARVDRVILSDADSRPAETAPPLPAADSEARRKESETRRARKTTRAGFVRNDIRVDLSKLDAMLDLVGELVIAEAMVTRHPTVSEAENESLEQAVHLLRRVANELQDTAMSLRMIPLSGTFRRMIRLVYDLSLKAGKQVNLELVGEDTEVDKTVIEHLTDPLVHIIRNAIDHGIESPAERRAAGKPETGRLVIEGRHEGGEVWILVSDDGRGLDRAKIVRRAVERGLVTGDGSDLTDQQVWSLIFEPGLSTAAVVSDISGRGVGMDVVRQNIEKLSGRIDVRSRVGEGLAIVLRIPLTLAIIDGMLVRAGESKYIIPLLAIRESLRPLAGQITVNPDGQEIVRVRDDLIPVVRLHEVFLRQEGPTPLEDGILVVVEGEAGELVALFADELLGQQETVIKGLTGWLKKARGTSGCTILGDGEVGLILDVAKIVQMTRSQHGVAS